MKETNIRMLFFRETQDWTVIIDGVPHYHLTSAGAEELVEYAMVVAEQTEMKMFRDDDDRRVSGLPN